MRSIQKLARVCSVGFMYLACGVANGQNAVAHPPVRAEIKFLSWDSTEPSSLWIQQEQAPAAGNEQKTSQAQPHQEVKCEPQEYSAPVNYRGARQLQMFRKGRPAENEAPFVPLATAELPADGGRCVLLLIGEGASMRALVIPTGNNTIEKGQLMLLNSTGGEFTVHIGTEKKIVAPHATAVFSVASFTDYQMPVEVFEKRNDEMLMKISTRAAVHFDQANLGILHQLPDDQRVSLSLLPPLNWEQAAKPAVPAKGSKKKK